MNEVHEWQTRRGDTTGYLLIGSWIFGLACSCLRLRQRADHAILVHNSTLLTCIEISLFPSVTITLSLRVTLMGGSLLSTLICITLPGVEMVL